MAADPAARQLLDELRALSAALQSLPQQKLGEDLSQQVLHVAERRMLTEGEPGDAALARDAAVSRTIFRRFLESPRAGLDRNGRSDRRNDRRPRAPSSGL